MKNLNNSQRKRKQRSLYSFLLKSDSNIFVTFLTTTTTVSVSLFVVTAFYLEEISLKSFNIINVTFPEKEEKHRKTTNIMTDDNFFLLRSSPYHIIFSTGCSIFQDWQSFVFFYHVMQSGQQGHVTRIASGCENEEGSELKSVFADEINPMRLNEHHLHLTPDYSRIKKKSKTPFKYFNKPFGVRHWMEHALGYPENHALHDDSIIILMDPDQILLRPFTNDFTNSSEIYKIKERERRKQKVEHGSPFSQQYGYNLQWLDKVNPEKIFKEALNETTPISNLSRNDARDYYMAMGPPYIATARDLYQIVTVWSDIVPKVHDDYPFLLAE